MINLGIISGTDRPGSYALRVSKYVQQKYKEQGVGAQIIDLQNFPVKQVSGGRYDDDLPDVDAFADQLISADGLVFVCPEYNGGYPGILKLFIDYLPFPESLNKKPVAMIGEAKGAFGAMRAVEQLQQVVGYRNAHLYPERVFIPRVHDNFDDDEGIDDEFQQELLESQVNSFPSFIQDVRKSSTVSGR
ncbi:NAD(P)H-dependent FMN reductase [Fodinibius salinus]|uniref:NAD(P)H-dependent FMN reductase n=1 Tax=Fodinibius salinus TaxID=860790 RepID=A0A5D3YEX4_9BACT|nr:NAD(P)H-dependent oxidoreductase [Fodinibius salinus]TYP92027.1 NAD(P)H-dependent FMN reductase [Fodinibius salinus]